MEQTCCGKSLHGHWLSCPASGSQGSVRHLWPVQVHFRVCIIPTLRFHNVKARELQRRRVFKPHELDPYCLFRLFRLNRERLYNAENKIGNIQWDHCLILGNELKTGSKQIGVQIVVIRLDMRLNGTGGCSLWHGKCIQRPLLQLGLWGAPPMQILLNMFFLREKKQQSLKLLNIKLINP